MGGITLKSIIDLIKLTMKKKLIIFGTGLIGKIIGEFFENRIEYFVDNDISKQNTMFLNKKVFSLEILATENKERVVIIIASMFYADIKNQLIKMGFQEKEHFWNGIELFDVLKNRENQKNTIRQTIQLEYQYNPTYRYGYGKPPHAILYDIFNSRRKYYKESLKKILEFEEKILNIKKCSEDSASVIEPYWKNKYMSGLDAITLYSMLSIYNPTKYMEIGSGNSTKFAYKAIKDNALRTKIISIDPFPRTEIDQICQEIYRKPVEELEISIFDQLGEGDILFVDNSHRCFTNSDVTVFFLEILPRLKPGVIVEIHDIYLPYDYPDIWKSRYYSEQYLLACYLLSGCRFFEIILANQFITQDDDLIKILDPIWNKLERNGISQRRGSSLWLRII